MIRKHNFHSVEFFRKIRDEQAAFLSDKPLEEIIAFFNRPGAPDETFQRAWPGALSGKERDRAT